MGDIMLCPDKIAMAKKMEQMGVDVIIHHTGSTSATGRRGSRRWRTEADRDAVKIPLQAVGGLSIDQARSARSWAPSWSSSARPRVADYELKPGADSDKLFETISNFVKKVKGL